MENYLEFNGDYVEVLVTDTNSWVPIKPICEIFNIDYNRQYCKIKEDEILSKVISIQKMLAADEKRRNMVCLPEYYIYGWLLSIPSKSEDLKKFKEDCYERLHKHFHKMVEAREKLIKYKYDLINKSFDGYN